MKVLQTEIEGVLLVEPRLFPDERGYFMETFQAARYRECGIPANWVQDNLSFSQKGTLRGLHYQIRHPQAKLVQVLSGAIFDVVVDVRPGSASFGRWLGVHLSGQNHRQLYIPAGFAHGFCVLSDSALFSYKCSEIYHPGDEGGILWSDPEVKIDWPVMDPIISSKDQKLPGLRAAVLD